MKKIIVLLALTMTAIHAHADVAADVAFLRTLAPVGSDVAMIQSAILNGDLDEATAINDAEPIRRAQ